MKNINAIFAILEFRFPENIMFHTIHGVVYHFQMLLEF